MRSSFPAKTDEPFDIAKSALKSSVLVGVLIILSAVMLRTLAYFHGQMVMFMVQDGKGGLDYDQTSSIHSPGGFDGMMEGGTGLVMLALQVMQVAGAVWAVLNFSNLHKMADQVAFMLVDTRKIEKLGKLLRIACGTIVFGFVLMSLSFILDCSLTLSMYVGTKIPLISYLTWVSQNYVLVCAIGVVIASTMAVWWVKTLEFPRDVSF